MADEEVKKTVEIGPGQMVVDSKMLTTVMEQMADLEKKVADSNAKNQGLEELFTQATGDKDPSGNKRLREKKNFEPAFRTVRVRKYPIMGDIENMGYVIGWTDRGAHQKVDRTGVSPQIVDFIDVVFLGHEKDENGKLKAEEIPLLSLLNAPQIHCKILEVKVNPEKVPTGEEISISVFDPKHGLVSTGEIIDGWVAFTNRSYVIQIPGIADPVTVDEKFLN